LDKLGAGINLDRNPIDNLELVKKWKIGTDHLVDYLEKRIALSDKPVVFEEFPRVSFKERTTYLEKQQSKQPKPKSENPNSNSHSSLLPSKTSTATMSASTANLSNTNQISTRYNSFPLVKANAFSSSNPVTTNSPTDRKPLPVSNSNNSLEEKLRVLAAWAESTISGELNTKVQLLKERLRTAKTASEALKIAQLTTGIRPETEKIHALLLGLGISIPPPRKGIPKNPEDKLKVICFTTENALNEFLDLLLCIQVAFSKSSQQQMISFVQIIKSLNQKLQLPSDSSST